jgi:hypothetical protein
MTPFNPSLLGRRVGPSPRGHFPIFEPLCHTSFSEPIVRLALPVSNRSRGEHDDLLVN